MIPILAHGYLIDAQVPSGGLLHFMHFMKIAFLWWSALFTVATLSGGVVAGYQARTHSDRAARTVAFTVVSMGLAIFSAAVCAVLMVMS